MREHETEDDMVAARAADLKTLMDNHQDAIAALPGVDPLPERPTADQLRTYDRQHTVRRDAFMAACVAYKDQVRRTVEQHQVEESVLRERLQSESPPVTTGL